MTGSTIDQNASLRGLSQEKRRYIYFQQSVIVVKEQCSRLCATTMHAPIMVNGRGGLIVHEPGMIVISVGRDIGSIF